MTFAARSQGGSGVYARSLLSSLREREDVMPWIIAGPRRSSPVATLRWLVSGAHRALKDRRPDVVHCPSFVMPWRIDEPVVVTVHDVATRQMPQDHPLEWRLYDRALMPARLRHAARVITGTEFARGEVIAAYALNPERVVAIPYGLDKNLFKPRPRPEPANSDRPMLFPGAPLSRKNLDAVLRCMSGNSTGVLGRASLEISGAREEDFPTYSTMIRSLGLQARVRWLGHLSREEMSRAIANAALVVYPSFYEGFGFPPLEAMAVGTPVIASNRASLPEVLGDAAVLIDPTDDQALCQALEGVLTRPELRHHLSEAGWKRALGFTWEKCAERTCELYRAVQSESRLPN